MPVRYFDVDPITTGLGYGFSSFMEGLRKKQAENEARTRARKAQQRKILGVAGGAVLGGVGGFLAAPALAAAGVVGATGMNAATAAGTAAATLGGASIGATAGGLIGGGDVAGGIESAVHGIAAPFVRQEARRQGLEDYTAKEAIQFGNALKLDAARTAGNIEQMRADPRNAELVAQQEQQAAEREYQAAVSSAPRTGTIIGSYDRPIEAGGMGEIPAGAGISEPIRAFGPATNWSTGGGEMPPNELSGGLPSPSVRPNIPGPSDVPGMSYRWSGKNKADLARLVHDTAETVDNPKWPGFNDPEHRSAEYQALARRREAIRPTLMEDQPTMEQMAQKQTWTDPKTGMIYHAKDVAVSMPPKDVAESPIQIPQADGTVKMLDADFAPVPKEMGGGIITRKGVQYHAPPKDGDDGGEKVVRKRYGDVSKRLTTKNAATQIETPPTPEKALDALQEEDEAIETYQDIEKYGRKVADRRATLRKTMRTMMDQFPGGPSTMPPHQLQYWQRFEAEYTSLGD